MEITKFTNGQGQFTLGAERSEYDAVPPTDQFSFDHAPATLNPERLAVAAYLMFGRWCGGDFASPWKFGPNTAAAINRDAEIDFYCRPIEFYPKALPLGSRRIAVATEARSEPYTFAAVRSDKWNGSLRSHSSLAVGTNYFVFEREPNDARPLLAAAVLFAEDLSADVLTVTGKSVPPDEQARLRDLLSAVRLGLEFH